MTSQAAIQKEIKEIKQRIIPPKDIWVIFTFRNFVDASHGKYGAQKLNIFTGETKPVDEATELEMMRRNCEELPDHCRKEGPFTTFEKYLKYHECKCGKPHPYHNPEYRQQNKWG